MSGTKIQVVLFSLIISQILVLGASGGRVVGWGVEFNKAVLANDTNHPGEMTAEINGHMLTNVVTLTAGESHSLALLSDGTVVGWGLNNFGQASGSNSPSLSTSPTIVTVDGRPLTNVVAIAAGSSHSLAVTSDGHVVAWGDNRDGQI